MVRGRAGWATITLEISHNIHGAGPLGLGSLGSDPSSFMYEICALGQVTSPEKEILMAPPSTSYAG